MAPVRPGSQREPLPQRGPFWTPITPPRGSLFHAYPHPDGGHTRGEDIVRDGDRPSECSLVLEGFAFRYKLLPDGRRQILAFHTPGDLPDLQSLHIRPWTTPWG